MTGDILVRQLRQVRPDLPVILCTGYSEKIQFMTADELKVHAILQKPVSRHLIAKEVRLALNGHAKH